MAISRNRLRPTNSQQDRPRLVVSFRKRSEDSKSKERLSKLTLDIDKAMREYLDDVGYAARRQKRDEQAELSKCSDIATGVAGVMGGVTATMPNPVTGFIAAMAGVLAGTCALSKHVEYVEDDSWDQYSILSGEG
ncbi:hypothetical protein AAG570_006756 [Ranatra chinensis]|uniref:Glycine zipper domain-containing protein n=1 Tax=Ranatra chinensis TaxID=642074 RepID=A0ABD0YUZ5_9HEMI